MSLGLLEVVSQQSPAIGAGQPDAPSALVDEVRAAVRAGQRPEYSEELPFDLDEARQVTLGFCRRAAALLAQRAPSTEADAYISWRLAIAESVAAVIAHHPPEASDTADAERTRAALATLTATLRGV